MNPNLAPSCLATNFLAAAPVTVRPLVEALQTLIQRTAPNLRLVSKWSFLCYEGQALVCGIGAFQQHASLIFFQGARLPDPDGLLTQGAGNASSRSVKLTPAARVPTAKCARLLRAAVRLDQEPPARPRVRRAALPVPDDLAHALRRDSRAEAVFAGLPPSCRREYIEWIVTAKRTETRARRLAAALEMLSRGQRHRE